MCLTEYDEEATNRAFREDGYIEGVEDSKAAGILEGEQKKAVEAARNLLKLKLGTFEQIAQAVSLPLGTVQQLAEEFATAKA